MKPFTKEHIDALDELIMARVGYILHHREGGWSNENLNADFDRLEKARNNLHALRVNDSEPVVMAPYSHADIPDYNITYTMPSSYNPETHIVMPRVWSTEQLQLVLDESGLNTIHEVNGVHYAITKVFGVEK